MNREQELKPCPFCGSANLKSGGDDKHVGYWCSECGSAGPNHYDSRYDWNRRAALEPAPKAQPLDLSNLLRHAFSCGYNSAAGEGGWEDYDPTACQAYHRIRAALSAPKAEAVEARRSGDAHDIANRLRAYFRDPGDARRLALDAAMMIDYLNTTSPVPALTDEAVEKDAARYRWLRDAPPGTSNRWPHVTQYPYQPKIDRLEPPQIRRNGQFKGEYLDEAIDAAISTPDALLAAFPSKGEGE